MCVCFLRFIKQCNTVIELCLFCNFNVDTFVFFHDMMYFLAFMCVNMSRSCLEYHLAVCFMAHRSTPPVPRESHPPGIPSWPSCNLIQMEKWLHWMFQSFMKCSLVVFTQPWSPAVSSGHDWKIIKTRLSNHPHLIVYGGYIITHSLNGGWNPRVYIYI